MKRASIMGDLPDIHGEEKLGRMPHLLGHIPAADQGMELLCAGERFTVYEDAEPAHRNSWSDR
jgi:hypothetical protein